MFVESTQSYPLPRTNRAPVLGCLSVSALRLLAENTTKQTTRNKEEQAVFSLNYDSRSDETLLFLGFYYGPFRVILPD